MKALTIKFIFPVLAIMLLCSMDQAKTKKFQLTDGITAKLPADFIPMSDLDIAQKYPSTKKPLAMYTSQDRMVDFGLNVTKSNWAGRNLSVLKDLYKSTLYTLYSEVFMIQEEIKEINGNYYIILEFTSRADQTKKYTYLQYGIFNNRVYLFNFTCPDKVKDKWQPVANEIMQTIKVKPKKLKEIEYNPSLETPEKGKNAREVLEHQKKKKNSGKTTQAPGK